MVLVNIAASLIDGAVIAPALGFEMFAGNAGQPLTFLVTLALLLPYIAVGVRRLHDIDRTGWWLLIGFIPFIGVLVLLYWFVQRGTDGSNRFGAAVR